MSFKEFARLVQEDFKTHEANTFSRKLLIFLFNMPFKLLFNYRLGYYLSKNKNWISKAILLYIKRNQIRNRNCDISYRAELGRRIKFPHPLSIVIGENSKIGDDVIIWQEVTLGSHGKQESKLEYPQIGNHVKLFSGCKIIGGVHVGDYAIVAANAVVLNDVPEHKIAVGIPAQIKTNKR